MASVALWDDPVATWDSSAYTWDGAFLGAGPTSFSITCAITGVSWLGEPLWTCTAPWGFISRPTVMEALQQLVWKAGAQYGGRMQAYFTNGTTNNTEVGTP